MTGISEAIDIYDFSNPNLYNEVYLPLFENKTRFIHLFGSAGSGKSVFGCQKEIVKSFRPERKNRKTLVVRKFYNTLKESVYAELKRIIHEWELTEYFEILKSPLSIVNKITGVEFVFFGLDDVEKIKSISGVDRVLIEEATELSEQSELDQLSLRLRGFDEVQLTVMYNPINIHHWLNKEIHEKLPADHFILKTTYKDNRFLDDAYARELERLKTTNPRYYKVYGLGEWGQNQEGLIYPEYEVVASMPRIDFYGLDFGYNEPCALIQGCVYDQYGQEKRDYFIKELLYKTKLTSDLLISELEDLDIDKFIPIVADCSRPEMIEALRVAGFYVIESQKGKGSVVAGINEVQLHNLKVVAGSKNFFKEIENYSWKNKNGVWLDEPVDSANHLMDAARYGLDAIGETSGSYETGVPR